MHQLFESDGSAPLRVCLTDKYPNVQAFKRAVIASGGSIQFHPDPVDATKIPAELKDSVRFSTPSIIFSRDMLAQFCKMLSATILRLARTDFQN